jgi:hypothetical protein
MTYFEFFRSLLGSISEESVSWNDQNRGKLSTMLAGLHPRWTRISSESDMLASKNASVEKNSEVLR